MANGVNPKDLTPQEKEFVAVLMQLSTEGRQTLVELMREMVNIQNQNETVLTGTLCGKGDERDEAC